MKKRTFILLAVAAIAANALHADISKGQKLYKKKVQKLCAMNGGAFAAMHTQDEWEAAKTSGTLATTMSAACPGGAAFFEDEAFSDKYVEHFYDFVYEYASDSGNVPSC